MHALAVALVLLHGVVTLGPTRPVCADGVSCTKPAAHVELVFRRGTSTPVRVRTDAQGRYAVRLRRGTYSVAVSPPPRIGSGLQPRTVALRAPRRLDFRLDTGIR